MTDEQKALSRRAVACKGWRWMPGMRTVYMEGGDDYEPGQAFRRTDWLECVEPYKERRYFHNGNIWYGPRDDGLPDLSDPATLGCLLALVREAWGCAVITSPDYDYDDDEARQGPHVVGWRAVETVRWMPVGEGKTEAEALVAALESAP